MWILKRIGCVFGNHLRAKRFAKVVEGTYFSRCAWCGVRMRQRGNKDWVVDKG